MALLSWLHGQALTRKAVSAVQGGRLKEAQAAFEDVVESRPRDWQAWCSLGECRADLGDSNGAENAFRECLDLNPESVEAREGLALVYAERYRDWLHALRTLEELLDMTREAGAPELIEVRIAWVHHLAGNSQSAEQHFAAALAGMREWEQVGVKEDAQFASTNYRLGALYHALRSDVPHALEHLGKAIELSPESVHAREAQRLMESISGRS
jgi:tetratricopeptide (TPR) repeat protein